MSVTNYRSDIETTTQYRRATVPVQSTAFGRAMRVSASYAACFTSHALAAWKGRRDGLVCTTLELPGDSRLKFNEAARVLSQLCPSGTARTQVVRPDSEFPHPRCLEEARRTPRG